MLKGEQRRLGNKDQILASNGLKINNSINAAYGGHYQGKDEASCYASYLQCAGYCPKIICCPCAACGCGPIKEVNQGQVGFLVEFGKLKAKLGPGLHTYNPCTENFILVDLRVQAFNPQAQQLLTMDNVTVTVDVSVMYKILVPELCLYTSVNYFTFLQLSVQSVMKSVVSERTLTQLLTNRKDIEKLTTQLMDEKAHPFGIDVIAIETQSISLTKSMERAMATVAESEKEAEAKVVKAKGNLESAKMFRKAADELSTNKVSMELKYYEVMRDVATEGTSILVVPSSIIDQVNKKLNK